MDDSKDLARWKFVAEGNVTIAPIYDAEGAILYIVVETDTHISKCRSPTEVSMAIDIAMHLSQYSTGHWIH